MKPRKIFWLFALMLLAFSQGCKKDNTDDPGDTVVDIDGNVYHLVTIGEQVWTVENLKTRHYQNGDSIQNGSGIKSSAIIDTTGTFWAYENNPSYILDYGLLYNWYAANDKRNIAPVGFHLPSDEEFGALVSSLGGDFFNPYGDSLAGGKLKETGTEHWGIPGDPRTNVGATNSSNWTGRPGGNLTWDGKFQSIRDYGSWWSSTSLTGVQEDQAVLMYLSWYNKGAKGGATFKIAGMSVKCIKDKR